MHSYEINFISMDGQTKTICVYVDVLFAKTRNGLIKELKNAKKLDFPPFNFDV